MFLCISLDYTLIIKVNGYLQKDGDNKVLHGKYFIKINDKRNSLVFNDGI